MDRANPKHKGYRGQAADGNHVMMHQRTDPTSTYRLQARMKPRVGDWYQPEEEVLLQNSTYAVDKNTPHLLHRLNLPGTNLPSRHKNWDKKMPKVACFMYHHTSPPLEKSSFTKLDLLSSVSRHIMSPPLRPVLLLLHGLTLSSSGVTTERCSNKSSVHFKRPRFKIGTQGMLRSVRSVVGHSARSVIKSQWNKRGVRGLSNRPKEQGGARRLLGSLGARFGIPDSGRFGGARCGTGGAESGLRPCWNMIPFVR